MYMEWNSGLELGLKIIDDQHRRLVELINDLASARDSNDNRRLRSVLGGLAAYAWTHFTVEEEFMLVYGYEGYAGHKGIHSDFVERVQALEGSMEGGDLDLPDSLMRFLVKWLSDHILKTDRILVDFLLAQGVRG